ncbi:MAG: hypothetical protein AMS16_01585 [Planctomycetes bacterium DG_58]|nr:MAG: hypothetical protein AMS16_01585 [Planctomycetes bacterium DG_58]KPL04853.1 MAG: hypothetical protein AMK75_00335 [Planctomycetes bacterium SM23_65]
MPKKVLVIDDNVDITRALTVRLRATGYELILAPDGATGLETARVERPDVILLDIRMPGIDGFEVNRRLKAIPELAEVPVIFLSAHTQGTVRQKAWAAGGECFLRKPYDAGQLMAVIEAVTGRTKSRST